IHGDDGRRAAMSGHARDAAARRFHPDSVAAKTVAVYREILERDGGSSSARAVGGAGAARPAPSRRSSPGD
ncbi:MAG: hypothetical protein QUU85_14785, partial [Candidatus Eisenbacteria bacterium]|nr:hypothetical protein [Candidatus Eisenbacteria bacterium]